MRFHGIIYAFLVLLFIFAIGQSANSKTIPFCVCYYDGSGSCDTSEPVSETEGTADSQDPDRFVACEGPWVRRSDIVKVSPGQTKCPFYTVDVTIFSPYGDWECGVQTLASKGESTIFKLSKDDEKIFLTITTDSISAAAATDRPNIFTTPANLGDDNRNPKSDRDTYSFTGSSGDNVVISLEENTESGHTGEQATLTIRNKNNSGSLREVKSDALPFEISTTLPEDGDYELVVEHRNIPRDLRFRGKYFLSVESDSAESFQIEPSLDVEQ